MHIESSGESMVDIQCNKCGSKKVYDPFLNFYYCKTCDPLHHEKVEEKRREEKRRLRILRREKVRDEYYQTLCDNIY